MDRWWYQSSYELSSGLEVREDGDTVPGDLLDEDLPLETQAGDAHEQGSDQDHDQQPGTGRDRGSG